MGDSSPYPQPPSNSGVLLSAVAGAVLGAAGVAWWLLSEAERRRLKGRQQRLLHISRLHDGSEVEETSFAARSLSEPHLQYRQLHDKVHELNQAIDDVRRQLEAMDATR